mgnify:FL=1
MAIKVLNSQVGLTRQSSSVETAKLNQDFGQDVFRGQMAVAEGIASVEEYQQQKKILDRENKKDEAVSGAMEDLIQLESEMYDVEGLYKDVPTADKEELFIKKRNEIISGYTKGYNTNLTTEIKNDYNAKSLQIVRQFSNAQNGIIKNKAYTNKVDNINNKANNIDYSNPVEFIKDLSAINRDLEFLLDTNLINADGFLALKNDAVTKLLNGAFEQLYPTAVTTENYTTTDDVDFSDMLELINGDTENDLLTPLLRLLNDDDAALKTFFDYQKKSVDAVNMQTNILEAESSNWLNQNQTAVRDINSDDSETRRAAFTLIENAFNRNFITEQVYNAARTKMNNTKGFAIADDPDVIIALNNDFDNGMLDLTDLAGTYKYQTENGEKEVDINDVLTKQTYDNFYTRVSTQQTKSESRATAKLYSTFNIEVGGINPTDPRHIAMMGFLNEAKVDMLNYLDGNFEDLDKKYGTENIDKLGFQKFSNLVIETTKDNSVGVRVIAFYETIKQLSETLKPDSIYSPLFVGNVGGPVFDVNNFNAWAKSAIDFAATVENPTIASQIRKSVNMARMTYNDYREFFDGIE